jgi:hypothetical protein
MIDSADHWLIHNRNINTHCIKTPLVVYHSIIESIFNAMAISWVQMLQASLNFTVSTALLSETWVGGQKPHGILDSSLMVIITPLLL